MNDAMTLSVTARLLRQGARVDAFSCGLSLLAFAAGWFALGLGEWLRLSIVLAVIVLGLAQRYFALRVAFDAELFAALEHDPKLDAKRMREFDQAMQSLELLPPDKGGRPWVERCRGALKLLNRQISIAVLQLVVALAGIIAAAWI